MPKSPPKPLSVLGGTLEPDIIIIEDTKAQEEMSPDWENNFEFLGNC
jgi:hypothetical protein